MRLFDFLNYLFDIFQLATNKKAEVWYHGCFRWWKIDPALLPPSPRTAFFHDLRVYHQIVVWKDLSDVNKEPLRWRWKTENSNYTLIMTDIEAEPPELLRIVLLGGKDPCGAKCSCRKAPAIKPKSHQNDYQRNFLDASKLYYIHNAAVIFAYWSCLRSSRCRCSGKEVFLKIAVLKVVR